MVQVTFAALSIVALAAISSVQAHPRMQERATSADCITEITGYLGLGTVSSKGVIRRARSNVALTDVATQVSSVTGEAAHYLETLDANGDEVAASSFEWANCTAALKASGWKLQLPSTFDAVFGPSTGKRFEYGWGILRPEGASVHCLSLKTPPVASAFAAVPLLSTTCSRTTHATRIFFAARELNNENAATFLAPVPLLKAGTTVQGLATVDDDTGGTVQLTTTGATTTAFKYLTLTNAEECPE